LVSDPDAPDARLVMAERGLWMVTGIVVHLFFYRFFLPLCWIPLIVNPGLANGAPVYGHLLGSLSLAVELAVMALLAVGVWRLVTRGRSVTQWIAGACSSGSGLAAAGFALALSFLGLDRALRLLVMWLGSDGPSAAPVLLANWMDAADAAVQIVIPVALLLWLARLRARLHPA
jgi:hypothetical protein